MAKNAALATHKAQPLPTLIRRRVHTEIPIHDACLQPSVASAPPTTTPQLRLAVAVAAAEAEARTAEQ